MNNINIIYMSGGKELIQSTKGMWYELTKIHEEKSKHFKEVFRNVEFEKRMNTLMKDDKSVYVQLAMDEIKQEHVAYIISSINKKYEGEIDSLYVNRHYRGLHIADKLMTQSLEWLKDNHAKNIKLGVVAGNEEVYGFYEKYGFHPRVSILERKD